MTTVKIKKIHIDGFGKWVNQDFTIPANPQIIFGNNEAGKTTLAIFIRSILFGFANAKGKNRYQQYLPRSADAYGGSLLVADGGKEYRITRTKGKNGGKVTVTDQAGHQFGRQKLTELLGYVDQELYQAVFGFNQADLSAVDNVNQEELQQHLRQVGAVGSSEWGQFITQLLKKGDEIFKPRGRKPVLNQHLKEYERVQGRLQDARAKYDDYTQLIASQKVAQQQEKQLASQLRELQPQLERLEQLSRLWPIYSQWNNGQEKTVQKQISDEKVSQVDHLRVQEQELHRQLQTLQGQLTELQGQASQFDHQQLTDYQNHRADYQRLQGELLQLQARADHQREQERLLTQRFRERNQIQERYGRQLPKPLSEGAMVRLEGMLKDQDRLPDSNRKLNLGLAVLGAALLLIGLVSHHGALDFIGILVLAGAGWGYYRVRNQQRQLQEKDQAALMEFGHQHGLSNFPIDQWLTMQPDLHRVAELNQELAGSQGSVTEIQHQLASIKRQLAGKVSGESAAELSRNLTNWLNQLTDKWQKLKELQHQEAILQQQLTETKHRLRNIQNEKWTIYQSVGVGNDEAFNNFLRKRAQARAQQATTTAYEKQLSAQDKGDLARFNSEEELRDQLSMAQHRVDTARDKLQQAQKTVQQDQLSIKNLVADGTLAELEQYQANLTTQLWQEAREWVSYQLAAQWIDRALVLASADRYPAIITAAERYFATLTDDRYNKIILDNDGVKVLDKEQARFDVGELSTGTAEQLYVALRLGFITVMSDQISLPIMIDDGFVNFDNHRRSNIMAILKQLAKNNQVIYFTADDRVLKFGQVLNLNQLDHE